MTAVTPDLSMVLEAQPAPLGRECRGPMEEAT